MNDLVDQREFPTLTDPWTFGSYRYGWTGLKPLPNTDIWVGQWLAWGPQYLYVNVPGFVSGTYHPGYVFNLTGFNRYITHETGEGQIVSWIRQGQMDLMDLMATMTVPTVGPGL
jgi:hypothetical protein